MLGEAHDRTHPYDSSVTCRKGNKTVKHNYTQYT